MELNNYLTYFFVVIFTMIGMSFFAFLFNKMFSIKKIEKTMDYKIVGGNDELLNSKIAENYRGYIEHNPFMKTKENPDIILEITAKLIEYTPNTVSYTHLTLPTIYSV